MDCRLHRSARALTREHQTPRSVYDSFWMNEGMDQGGVRCMNISGQNLFKDLDIVQSKVEVADQEIRVGRHLDMTWV